MELKLEVPFKSPEHAVIAYNSLCHDPEPPRSGLSKKLTVVDSVLRVDFEAPEVRSLRVGVNSFLDLLVLVVNTVDEFAV